jgi:hypothetical protein
LLNCCKPQVGAANCCKPMAVEACGHRGGGMDPTAVEVVREAVAWTRQRRRRLWSVVAVAKPSPYRWGGSDGRVIGQADGMDLAVVEAVK